MPGPSGVPASEYVLEMDEVSKRFGNVIAISQVSFKLRHGLVHALLDENGAGKSTHLANRLRHNHARCG